MNSPLEDRLREDLAHLATDVRPLTPDVDAIERRGRRLRTRTMAVRGVAGLAVAAGMTAVALAVSTTGTAGITSTPTHTAQGATPVPSVHDIEVRTVAAVTSAATSSIMRSTTTDAGEVQASTIDAADQVSMSSTRKSGQPLTTSASRQVPGAAKGDFEIRTIDFTKHEWSEQHQPGPGIGSPAVAFLRVLRGAELGGAKFVGTETIDGRIAFKLDLALFGDPSGHYYLWIDQATSLPIKSVSPGGTATYTWSAAGSFNPATLWPDVPAGFAKVDAAQLPAR